MKLRQRSTSDSGSVALSDLLMFSFLSSTSSSDENESISTNWNYNFKNTQEMLTQEMFTQKMFTQKMFTKEMFTKDYFPASLLINNQRYNLSKNHLHSKLNRDVFLNRNQDNKGLSTHSLDDDLVKRDHRKNFGDDTISDNVRLQKRDPRLKIEWDTKDVRKQQKQSQNEKEKEKPKEKIKCCCIKGESDENELEVPLVNQKKSTDKTFKDFINFINGLKSMLERSLEKAETFCEEALEDDEDEVTENMMKEHLESVTKQLKDVTEFNVTYPNYFDYLLKQPILYTNCSGDMDKIDDEDYKENKKYQITMTSNTRMEENGTVKISGSGKLECKKEVINEIE